MQIGGAIEKQRLKAPSVPEKPGDRVIDLGADGLSRSEGKDWGGYGLNSAVWRRVCHTATAGKTLTVDLFASSSNNKCQRFHSFHQTQGTERADAFDRLSWAHSKCPCGQTHSEYLYVFQPMDLLLPKWLRLERDGAAGIAIVPMSPAAPWWTIMKCGYKHTPAPSDAFELCHQQDRTTKLMASTQHPVCTRTPARCNRIWNSSATLRARIGNPARALPRPACSKQLQ